MASRKWSRRSCVTLALTVLATIPATVRTVFTTSVLAGADDQSSDHIHTPGTTARRLKKRDSLPPGNGIWPCFPPCSVCGRCLDRALCPKGLVVDPNVLRVSDGDVGGEEFVHQSRITNTASSADQRDHHSAQQPSAATSPPSSPPSKADLLGGASSREEPRTPSTQYSTPPEQEAMTTSRAGAGPTAARNDLLRVRQGVDVRQDARQEYLLSKHTVHEIRSRNGCLLAHCGLNTNPVSDLVGLGIVGATCPQMLPNCLPAVLGEVGWGATAAAATTGSALHIGSFMWWGC